MSDILPAIGLVLLLILVGGFFAAAEMSLVSLRESQVRALSERGRRGARVSRLSQNPNLMLAAVQIGVTLAGFLSAAYGESQLSSRLEPVLQDWGLSPGLSNVVALIVITGIIAYFSLVFAELAPKRLALQRAEGIALFVAPVLDVFATVCRPVIWLLSRSTNVVVRLLGGDPTANREAITEEELRDLVTAHESLTRDERRLIEEVFAAGDHQLREVMLPRTEVEFLDASMSVARAVKIAQAMPHSRFPVIRGSQDDVAGFVHVRDLLLPAAQRRGVKVGDVTREVMMFPASKRLLPALSEMRRGGHHLAVVVDEYGGTAGIVTLEDLIEELIGDIRDEYDVAPAEARRLRSGDIDVDGLLNLDDFEDETDLTLPDGPYETVAGYIMAVLGRLPRLGDAVEVDGARLKVSAMDGRRVARVRVSRPTPEEEPARAARDDGSAPTEDRD